MYAPQFAPLGRGFNFSNGFLCGGEDHFDQAADLNVGNCSGAMAVRDIFVQGAPAPQLAGEYTGTRFADAAVASVREHAARHGAGAAATAPLFLYLALHNTHAPLQALPAFEALYANVSFAPQRNYYAMMSTVDSAVGNVTAALKEAGMWDNTLFVWTNDNGAPVQVGGSNFPLRGGKGSNFEGGVKVPALFAGGVLAPALRGAVAPSSDYAHIVDLYATFLSAAGLPPADPGAPDEPIDSVDLLPWLTGAAPASPRAGRTLAIDHTRYNEAARGQRGALRKGGYKLLVGATGGEAQASWYGRFSPNASDPAPSLDYFACDGSLAPGGCLFAVGAGDAEEREDLAAALPAVFGELLAEFRALNATPHAPENNPPSDEAGLCAAAVASDYVARPWRAQPLPEALVGVAQ
jgi:arylsulfatase B